MIDETYIERIASEINEKLIETGELNVADLTVQYDLPSDFLMREVMEKYQGKLIFGKQDTSNPRIFFTESYVQRCRAKIRGALAGITLPTSVSAILSQAGIKERIFFTLTREVNITGTLTARSVDAMYIPHIYSKMQSDYVQSFFQQNGYLEFTLPGLDVADPKSFIQSQLSGESYKQLSTCIVAQRIIDQVASALDECIATNNYLDISTITPSAFTEADIEQLISITMTPAVRKTTTRYGNTIFTSKYLDELVKPSYDLIKERAKEAVESGKYQQYMIEKQLATNKLQHKDDADEQKVDKREERRKKAAGGSAGGGAQGRETKTKSTKKHGRNQRRNDSNSEDDDDLKLAPAKGINKKVKELELIHVNDLKKLIKKPLEEEGLEDLAGDIATQYYPALTKTALTLAQELFETSSQNKNQNRRQTHAALQDKLNTLINDIRLYEKGLKLLPGDMQSQLTKYLLKSIGNDVCNEVTAYVAAECNLNCGTAASLTVDQRNKIANDCEKEYKATLQTLNKTANGTSLEEFVNAAESALQACSMILRKVDKKKDRTLILCHKHELLERLEKEKDPPLVLHLAALVIFTVANQAIIHASGRHVSGILTFLQNSLSPDQNKILQNYHGKYESISFFYYHIIYF